MVAALSVEQYEFKSISFNEIMKGEFLLFQADYNYLGQLIPLIDSLELL